MIIPYYKQTHLIERPGSSGKVTSVISTTEQSFEISVMEPELSSPMGAPIVLSAVSSPLTSTKLYMSRCLSAPDATSLHHCLKNHLYYLMLNSGIGH